MHQKTAKLAQLTDSKIPVTDVQHHGEKTVKSLKLKRSKPPVAHVQLHDALKGTQILPSLGFAISWSPRVATGQSQLGSQANPKLILN